MGKFIVFGMMTDCGDEQELAEFDTLADAVKYMRKQETTAHPDIAFWAEEGGSNVQYDSCTDIAEDCGYCGSSKDPNDICLSCWNSMP